MRRIASIIIIIAFLLKPTVKSAQTTKPKNLHLRSASIYLRPMAEGNNSLVSEGDMFSGSGQIDFSRLPDFLTLFAKQLKRLAEYEDTKFLKNPYWNTHTPLNRYYQSHPLYSYPSKRELRKERRILEKKKQEYSKNPPGEYLIIFGNQNEPFRIHYSNVKEINKHLIPQGWLYYIEEAEGGKNIFLLGKIDNYKQVNGLDTYVISKEVISNRELYNPAFFDFKRKIVIARNKASEFIIWRRLNLFKKGKLYRNERALIKLGFEALLGISEQEMLKLKPVEIAEKIKKTAAQESAIGYLSHEQGHLAGEKFLSYEMYEKGAEFSEKSQDKELNYFIRALDDSVADTVIYKNIKGRYPALIEQKEPVRFGLFCFCLYNILFSDDPLLGILMRLEREFFPAFLRYAKTGDINYILEANEKIVQRWQRYITLLREGKYEDWKKVQQIAEKEFKADFDKIQTALDEMKNLQFKDLAPSIRENILETSQAQTKKAEPTAETTQPLVPTVSPKTSQHIAESA